ncbi:MAG: enoyl-CoA hydratase-related protein [Myxococcota bacterium]|nr:enoyl-CoA hydratase-related protein [Myxococcota bacterium]
MKYLEIKKSGARINVSLNRPEVRNAFNDELIAELKNFFMGLDKEVKVVVLSGNGKTFCAGADLNWMRSTIEYTQAENVADSRELASLFATIRHWPGIVIARVHGAALGGGLGLVAASDIAVACQECKFGLTEVRLGLIPAVISPFVIEKIGASQARRYFTTAEIFLADRARDMGLVHECVSFDELDDVIEVLCARILENGPEAIAHAKRLVFEVTKRKELSDALEYAAGAIAERRVSSEGQEGLTAFLEKRKPQWK